MTTSAAEISSSGQRRFVLSALSFAIKIAGAGVALLVTFTVTWLLGSAGSGQYFTLVSIVSLIYAVARLGLGYSTYRAAAEYATSEPRKVQSLTWFVTGLVLATSVAAAATVALISGPICEVLFGDRNAQGTLLMLALTIPAFCVGSIAAEVLKGLGYPLRHALFENVSIKVLALPCVLVGGIAAGQIGIATGFLAANVLALGLVAALVVHALRPLGRLPLDRQETNSVLAATPFLTALALWPVALQWLPQIVISYMARPEDAAMYYVAARIVAVMDLVPMAVAAVWGPMFIVARASGGMSAVWPLLGRSILLIFASSVCLSLPLILVAKEVMGLFGREFASAATLLQVMLAWQCIVAPLAMLNAAAIAARRERSIALTSALCAAILCGSLVVGTQLFGALGAATAAALCAIVYSISVTFRMYRPQDGGPAR